jgi:hypothetical protein
LLEDAGIVLRPLCQLQGDSGKTGKFKESQIEQIITDYTAKLSETTRKSFAPPEMLTSNSMKMYDP